MLDENPPESEIDLADSVMYDETAFDGFNLDSFMIDNYCVSLKEILTEGLKVKYQGLEINNLHNRIVEVVDFCCCTLEADRISAQSFNAMEYKVRQHKEVLNACPERSATFEKIEKYLDNLIHPEPSDGLEFLIKEENPDLTFRPYQDRDIEVTLLNQKEKTSCGQTSVAMLTGVPVSEVIKDFRHLRRAKPNSRLGSTVNQIRKLLQHYGLELLPKDNHLSWNSIPSSGMALVSLGYNTRGKNILHWVGVIKKEKNLTLLDPSYPGVIRYDNWNLSLQSFVAIKEYL